MVFFGRKKGRNEEMVKEQCSNGIGECCFFANSCDNKSCYGSKQKLLQLRKLGDSALVNVNVKKNGCGGGEIQFDVHKNQNSCCCRPDFEKFLHCCGRGGSGRCTCEGWDGSGGFGGCGCEGWGRWGGSGGWSGSGGCGGCRGPGGCGERGCETWGGSGGCEGWGGSGGCGERGCERWGGSSGCGGREGCGGSGGCGGRGCEGCGGSGGWGGCGGCDCVYFLCDNGFGGGCDGSCVVFDGFGNGCGGCCMEDSGRGGCGGGRGWCGDSGRGSSGGGCCKDKCYDCGKCSNCCLCKCEPERCCIKKFCCDEKDRSHYGNGGGALLFKKLLDCVAQGLENHCENQCSKKPSKQKNNSGKRDKKEKKVSKESASTKSFETTKPVQILGDDVNVVVKKNKKIRSNHKDAAEKKRRKFKFDLKPKKK